MPRKNETDYAHLNLAVPKADYERLREIANNEDRTITKQIQRIIREFIEKYNK